MADQTCDKCGAEMREAEHETYTAYFCPNCAPKES